MTPGEAMSSARIVERDSGVDGQAQLQAVPATRAVREFERVEPSLGELFRTVIGETGA